MANSSFVIVVSTPRSKADAARYIKDTSEPREECRALSHWFDKIMAGSEPGAVSFDVSQSTSAPVRASGTFTLAYASIANSDTVAIGKTTLTCVTGTPSGAQFKKQTDGPTTAANFAAAVNANTTLNKFCIATNTTTGVGVVTIKVFANGTIGNEIAIATSNGTGFVVSGSGYLTSGAGGSENTATSYTRG